MQKTSIKLNPYIIKNTDFIMTSGSKDVRIYDLRLRDLSQEDKPREKMLSHGPSCLSLSELVAIVLNVGTKTEDVLSMSKRLVKEYGVSALSSQVNPEQIATDLNIPIVKACQIVACSEIGRRLYKKNDIGLAVIRTAKDTYDYLKDMHSLPKEQLRGIYLDTHNRVIHDEVISIGTINTNIVHPREVFRPALEYGAVALVLAHNHPSGIVSPSTADIEITKQLIQAGKIIGIHVLDHVVISKDGFQSIDVNYQ
ncbi:MAG: DNA repair protein RadC [bacterium]